MNTAFYAIWILIGTFISAVSQVLLKREALKKHKSFWSEYLNLRVVVAYVMFFAATVFSIMAYKGIPLSLGPVLESTSYIYVTILGVKFFREKISKEKIFGLVIMIAGIVIYSFS